CSLTENVVRRGFRRTVVDCFGGDGLALRCGIAKPFWTAMDARGVQRLLWNLGYASLTEFPLANGQRADILALGKTGDLVIVEIKSSVANFRADRKWTVDREFADRLYLAVPTEFRSILIPEVCCLMVADA